MKKQVVSKKRVADHGEVLTGKREVNAMLDLVKQETERIESRFLEPACGTGNFLIEILDRKLRTVKIRYQDIQSEYEHYAILAVSSIYGIDILEDNVVACRTRLFELFEGHYDYLFRNEDCLYSVKFLLERNIIWGDALTLTTVGPNPQPIVFSEWSPVSRGRKMKRRDFTFQELLSFAGTKELPLFSDQGDEVFFPTPVREFRPTPTMRLFDVEKSPP